MATEKRKWYKLFTDEKVAILGLLFYFFLILVATIIFNYFWTGAGTSSQRSILPPLSTDPTEIKEYMTLYIAILSFTAAIFAPLVVFLVYDSWKHQYHYTKNNDRYILIFERLLKLNSKVKILRNLDIGIRGKNPNENLIAYTDNYLDEKYEWYLNKIQDCEILYEEILNDISLLELSLNSKLDELKQLSDKHQFKLELYRDSFYKILKHYETGSLVISEDYKNLRQIVSSRDEMKIAAKYKETSQSHYDEYYVKTETQFLIEIQKEIIKMMANYKNKLET